MATIIFDFDDTLFDTQLLKEKIFNKLTESGASNDIIYKAYKDSQESVGIYSPSNHIKILKDLYNVDIEENFNDWIMNLNVEPHVFPEVSNLLNNLSKKHHLILLTLGDKDFQKFKIDQSKISQYFNEVYIIDYSKEIFLKDIDSNQEIYFINDKENENQTIKNNFPNFNIIKKEHGKPLQLPMS